MTRRQQRPQRRRPARPPIVQPEGGLELTVDGFTHGGEGVARWIPDAAIEGRGKAVFVPGALPGEKVRVHLTEDRKKFARGVLLEVLEPAAGRVAPPCVHAKECGGCDLQHASVPTQLELKARVVREQLQKIGRIAEPNVLPTIAASPPLGYRSHATLHSAGNRGIGFHKRGSSDVVEIEQCIVLRDGAQELVDKSRRTGADSVTVHAHDDRRAVLLDPGAGPLDLPPGGADVLVRQPDGTALTLRGDGLLTSTVGDFTYRFDPTCFFQVSPEGAATLVELVRAAVGDIDGAVVWDLYAGVGLFSIPLAADGGAVIAVEGHGSATAWARLNAEAAGVEIEVHESTILEFVNNPPDDPDVVVLDPPRAGAGEAVTKAIAASRPAAVVYVSCDPAALARDARTFAEEGYHLRKAQPVDLFPMTHHVETVAVFTP